jgi:phosphopantothenate-cysteine ligase
MPQIVQLFDKYQQHRVRLLPIAFTSVSDYLALLQLIASLLAVRTGRRLLLYLAAAVSDFYIPERQLVCDGLL